MDRDDFFREATLTICGNLDIGEALAASLQFLRNEMPVERMWLQFFDEGLGSMHILAHATEQEGSQTDWVIPLSRDALEELRRFAEDFSSQDSTFAWLFDDNPRKLKMVDEIFGYLQEEVTSLIVLPLRLKLNKLIGGGSLVLAAAGDKPLSREDRDLITFIREPFSIAMANTLKHLEAVRLRDLLADENRFLHGELRKISGEEIVGMNFGLKEVMTKAGNVAKIDSPVLLLGETGSGKDVIANAIHYSSPRRENPFIKVNCGAIPDTLIDSELFGHEKGAFTGAVTKKRGFFERADTGTIFLDEIGELPLQAQVRLLRVLQDKQIERVGGTKTIELDIRVIAATNRDLEDMVETGDFRQDLWFRLNVFPIEVPPLRQRKIDIPALVQYFILQKTRELKLSGIPDLAAGAIDPLMEYDWPGNVRELANIVERALILNPYGPLTFENLDQAETSPAEEISGTGEDIDNLEELIKFQIHRVLKKTGGKIHGSGGAAELLGINPSTLRSRMAKLGIEPPSTGSS